MSEPPFLWNTIYVDPAGATQTVASGKDKVLERHDGGIIRIQPPVKGSGVLKFASFLYCIVENPGSTRAKFAKVLGTAASMPGGKPLYPYLGVVHGRGGNDYGGCDDKAIETLEAGGKIAVSDFRLDVVDNGVMQDEPIKGWPDWAMTKAQGQSEYPGIAPVFYCYEGGPLTIRNIMVMGFAT